MGLLYSKKSRSGMLEKRGGPCGECLGLMNDHE